MQIFTRCFTTFFLLLALSVGTLSAFPFAYVSNIGSNTISVIDIPTNTVVDTISATTPSISAITHDGSRVYVTTGSVGNVLVIDVATNTVIDTINVGVPVFGIAIRFDDMRAYVVNSSTNSMTVIDITNNTVIGTIALPAGSGPSLVALTPDGTRAYVTATGSNEVLMINLTTNTVEASIPVGNQPLGIAITPDGTKAYVVNQNSNNVTVIDLNNNTPIVTIPVAGQSPSFVTIAPNGGIAYVVSTRGLPLGSPTVTPIEVATDAPKTPLAISSVNFLFDIAITSDSKIAYITGSGVNVPGVVFPLDLITGNVGTPIPVGATPAFVSITPSAGAIVLVRGITPTSGPTTGGTPVTITGIGFTGATQVLFGTTPAASFVVNSDTSITAVSPPGTGAVDVIVVVPFGVSPITPTDLFTYTPPPPPPHPFAPKKAHGHQVINRFATQTDYVNVLTWKAPTTGPTPVEYRIYRDADLKELIAVISADRELKFKDHNRKKGKTYTYFIVSVDALGLFSEPAVVIVKPR